MKHVISPFSAVMRRMGADYFDLQVYVCQSVGTVMSMHYDKPSLERLAEIAGRAQKMVEDC